jgi:hypothetical protein
MSFLCVAFFLTEMTLSHYLRTVRWSLRIFPPSHLPGTSPSTSFIYPPVCKQLWAPALFPNNKPCAGIEWSSCLSILHLFHSNSHVLGHYNFRISTYEFCWWKKYIQPVTDTERLESELIFRWCNRIHVFTLLQEDSDRETGPQSFQEASLLSRPAANQQIWVQRLSVEKKGASLKYHLEQVTEIRGTACPIHGHILFHWLF